MAFNEVGIEEEKLTLTKEVLSHNGAHHLAVLLIHKIFASLQRTKSIMTLRHVLSRH